MTINCSTAMALMRTYFNYPIANNVKDAILTHLIKCERCRTVYMDYAKAIGMKFELMEEIEAVYNEYDSDSNKKDAKMDESDTTKSKRRTYHDMAKEKDVSSLMNIQCARDYFKETFEVKDSEMAQRASEFGWYVVEKMCKNIDKLEQLYNLSGDINSKDKDDSKKA